MCAWLHTDGAREVEGHAASLSGKSFDNDLSHAAVASVVVVDQPEEAGETFQNPQRDCSADVGVLRQLVQVDMDPSSRKGEEGEELMEMEKRLIEGVADWRERLQHDETESYRADGAPVQERLADEFLVHACEAVCFAVVDSPGDGVCDSLDDDCSPDPAMQHVVCVEADL